MSHQIRWTVRKIAARLRLITPLIYRRAAPLDPFRYQRLPGPEVPPPVTGAVDNSGWQILSPGDFWGERESDFALRTRFHVPDGWSTDVPSALVLSIGEAPDFIHPEALVYVDGEACGAVDRFHREISLDPAWHDGQEHLLVLRGFTGIWKSDQDGKPYPMRLQMGQSKLVQSDPATRAFVAAARVALETVKALDEKEPVRWKLLDALDAAFRHLDTREPMADAFYATVPRAHELLQEGISAAGPTHPTTITATGHAHLDLAWLWTVGQAKRKAGRSFTNVIRLMDEFPNYHFTQSQPQLYEFVHELYPDLFAQIKERVAEGRWEPLGGMWVEADCNISGPESLARQLLLGQNYLRHHFGEAVSPILWLPDVFGYAWNLPQLIKQAGLEYFFTIKIGWSQYNRLPYDSFWWQGLDGSRVLTHFSTTPELGDFPSVGTYNAELRPAAALGTWEGFQQKELQQEFLMTFGYGDGGGGPNREMLENLNLMADFPGLPRIQSGSAAEFFRRLERNEGPRLPVWNGELYLELHRGTYTSQSRNKRANRKSEFLLHDAEFAAAFAAWLDPAYKYPHEELRQVWELVCLNQFHDIIPGSSIQQVYVESLAQYKEVEARGRAVRKEALATVADHVGGDLIVVNPSGFHRNDPVFWEGTLPQGVGLEREGVPLALQRVDGGTLIDAGPVPPYSATSLHRAQAARPSLTGGLGVSRGHLENAYVRVEFDENGDIVRLYDKVQERELLPAGARANEWQAFEDRPLSWDAWDVDIFYDDRMWRAEPAQSVRVAADGPLRATLEIRRRILNSPYTQRISLDHNSPTLHFDTTIDWRERHILLKAAFPVELLAPTATYEIQWGNVERPTHRNTSWDWARFETVAQKWVDLSEGNYGVSLLNDCKYGHDIHENVLRISLLRSPTHPDPEADQGKHKFTYALLPHSGRWGAETMREAYALNDPLLAVAASGREGKASLALVSVDGQNVVIETVKQAEDGRGLIVRMYEAMRQRGVVTVRCAFTLRAATLTNLLEEDEQALEVNGKEVRVPLRPYQIVTLRLEKQ